MQFLSQTSLWDVTLQPPSSCDPCTMDGALLLIMCGAGGGGWHGTRAMRQPLLSGTYSPCKHGFHPSLSWALQPHIMHKTKRPFEGKPPRMTWCALNASTQLDPTTAPFSSHCQLSLSFQLGQNWKTGLSLLLLSPAYPTPLCTCSHVLCFPPLFSNWPGRTPACVFCPLPPQTFPSDGREELACCGW